MPFTQREIERGLAQVTELLAASTSQVTFHVVGGAAVMLQVGRDTLTSDVDALFTPTPEIDEAIRNVAVGNGWNENWLNNGVIMYASHFDQVDDWELLVEVGNVKVLIARAPLLLAMKLLAGRGRRDTRDLEVLLDACGVRTLSDVEEIFDRYYPTEVISPSTLQFVRAQLEGKTRTN